jgi:hypothetical protein
MVFIHCYKEIVGLLGPTLFFSLSTLAFSGAARF